MSSNIEDIATEIADQVVPAYRRSPKPCAIQIAKRWSAAYKAVILALKGPKP